MTKDVTFGTWRGHQSHVMCLTIQGRKRKKSQFWWFHINLKVARLLCSLFWFGYAPWYLGLMDFHHKGQSERCTYLPTSILFYYTLNLKHFSSHYFLFRNKWVSEKYLRHVRLVKDILVHCLILHDLVFKCYEFVIHYYLVSKKISKYII